MIEKPPIRTWPDTVDEAAEVMVQVVPGPVRLQGFSFAHAAFSARRAIARSLASLMRAPGVLP